jgi:hypothetical protein
LAIITVTGQFGSGSQEIGKQIAWKLHADYVDREITTMIAKRLRYIKKNRIARTASSKRNLHKLNKLYAF